MSAFARAAWELNRHDQARAIFATLTAQECADIPRDTAWLANLALLSELAVLLGDTRRCVTLYDLLLPYAEHNVYITSWWVCYGSVEHYLGLLAAATRHWDDASQHFENALIVNKRIGARPHLTHTQSAFAAMLVTRDAPGDREKALDLVNQALSTAEEIGMTRLAEQALALKVRVQGILKA